VGSKGRSGRPGAVRGQTIRNRCLKKGPANRRPIFFLEFSQHNRTAQYDRHPKVRTKPFHFLGLHQRTGLHRFCDLLDIGDCQHSDAPRRVLSRLMRVPRSHQHVRDSRLGKSPGDR
jgi:hypothetical protein